MRTLSERELDQIFAGDGGVSATMPTVTVTAPKYEGGYGFPYGGSNWGGPSYMYETDDWCYASAGAYNALPWSQMPDIADVRCEVNAAADPGMSIPTTAGLHFVNNYAYLKATDSSVLHNTSSSTPSGYAPLTGRWAPAHNSIFLYAGGSVSANSTGSYYDYATNTVKSPWRTSMTAIEYQILVVAHEAAHANGVGGGADGEAKAEGRAVNALKRFRAQGAKCP